MTVFSSPKAFACWAGRLLAGLCGLLAAATIAAPAFGGALEIEMPVPSVVIYPGQDVIGAGLTTRAFIVKDDKLGLFAADTEALADHVARRMLLPGKAIRMSDLAIPDAVKAGTQVTLVYSADGLIITGLGTALQSAGEGDVVRVRNIDSGVIVSGTVGSDGSVTIQG